MSVSSEDIESLVDVVVRPLVEYPDDFSLSTTVDESGDVLVEITVNEEDIGKVIGRQGRVIKSVRTLARAAAARSNFQVDVELAE